jgi:uncharacterized protein
VTDPCTAIIHKALKAVRPQFRLQLRHGIHGVPHWSRVWVHGRMLSAALDMNPAVLAWFSFLHDSRRFNDHQDPLHGERAADFAVQLQREHVINELNPTEFENLCEAMRLHSDGHTVATAAIQACWDADRLDLGRVGIRPKPSRLCSEPAKQVATIEAAMLMSISIRRSSSLAEVLG